MLCCYLGDLCAGRFGLRHGCLIQCGLSAAVEVALVHRSIGQERFGFASEPRPASSLDGLSGMVDWTEIAGLLAGIHANADTSKNRWCLTA